MVWCARESLDYVSSPAMVCDHHNGWIHWDPLTLSWHSVTNRQLSTPWRPTAEQAALRDTQAAVARTVEAVRAAQDAQAAGDQRAVAAQLAAAAQAAAEARSAAERAAEAASAAQGDARLPVTIITGPPPIPSVIYQPAHIPTMQVGTPTLGNNGVSEEQS